MFYENIVYQHFENPCNVGNVKNPTHTAMVGNPESGAVIKLTSTIKNNVIENIMFKAYGGGAAIACMSLLTQKVKGLTVEQAMKINSNDLNNELSLEPIKYIYSILAVDALHKMLETDF